MTVDEIRPTALDELAAALAAFQAEAPVIAKTKTARIQTERGRDYAYTYADLAAIASAVLPLLAKHGLAFITMPTAGERPLLVAMLVHTSGQYVTGELPIMGRTPQEIGSSLTYGRRYLLGCLTGVVTDDDDDGALATKAARRKGTEEPAPVAPAPQAIQRRNRPRPEGAASAEPPTGQPETTPTDEGTPGQPEVSDAARRALFGAVGKFLGPTASRAERLALCAAVVGRPIPSSTDLGRSEISAVLNWLDAANTGRATWTYDPNTEMGVARYTPPEPVEDTPLPEPPDPWT